MHVTVVVMTACKSPEFNKLSLQLLNKTYFNSEYEPHPVPVLVHVTRLSSDINILALFVTKF